MAKQEKIRKGCVIKTLLMMYIITGLLLVLLAFIVSKVQKEDLVAQIGVIAIYVISCGFGGYVIGKWKKQQKFLWCLLAGVLYVAVLLVIALVIQKGDLPHPIAMGTTAAICAGAGMIGGMVS